MIEFHQVARYFCETCERWTTIEPCPACTARAAKAAHVPVATPVPDSPVGRCKVSTSPLRAIPGARGEFTLGKLAARGVRPR